MKPVEGKISTVLSPETGGPACPQHTHLGAAHHLMLGATVLAGSPAGTEFANAFICGQALECMLKAFLVQAKVDEAKLRSKPLQHNLDLLWELAEAKGLGVSRAAFAWAQPLSELHREPDYLLRYSNKMGAISLPRPGPMTTELNALLATIRAKIVS